MRGSCTLLMVFSILHYFNSRLYMRGSMPTTSLWWQHAYFNSRLYMRGSVYFLYTGMWKIYFNSRLYMRGSRYPGGINKQEQFQFTPLHERQLFLPLASCFSISISIHASTWEAAPLGLWLFLGNPYFNSRLYMRGSEKNRADAEEYANFNSRLYMRGSCKNTQFFQ